MPQAARAPTVGAVCRCGIVGAAGEMAKEAPTVGTVCRCNTVEAAEEAAKKAPTVGTAYQCGDIQAAEEAVKEAPSVGVVCRRDVQAVQETARVKEALTASFDRGRRRVD